MHLHFAWCPKFAHPAIECWCRNYSHVRFYALQVKMPFWEREGALALCGSERHEIRKDLGADNVPVRSDKIKMAFNKVETVFTTLVTLKSNLFMP